MPYRMRLQTIARLDASARSYFPRASGSAERFHKLTSFLGFASSPVPFLIALPGAKSGDRSRSLPFTTHQNLPHIKGSVRNAQ